MAEDVGGITNPIEVISQLTYLMFIRSLDEKELEAERMEQVLGVPQPRIFPEAYRNAYGAEIPGEELRWSRFKDKSAQEMYRIVSEFVFPFIKELGDGSAFSKAMESATFGFPAGKPSLLEKAVDGVEGLLAEFDEHIGDLGDLYEYMLSKLSTAGTNGQFMPYLYAAAGNIDATGQSLLGVVQWVLVAVCSLAIFSRFGDIVSHRVLFGASALLALLSWVAIAVFGLAIQSGDTESMGWVLWVYVILWGISAGFSAQCFYALWGTELFPTQYRGGAQGIMFFLVRGALGIWSLVGVGAIMGDISTNPAGFFPAAVIMCVVLLISLVVGVIWCPKTQGKTLDQITEERYGKIE